MCSGHLDGALELCEQLLAEARAASDLNRQADTLYMMSEVAFKNGQLDEARAYMHETAELAMAYGGYPLRLIECLTKAATCARRPGGTPQRSPCGLPMLPRTKPLGSPTRRRMASPRTAVREARQALEDRNSRLLRSRGAAMTLAAAVEFAVMMQGRTANPAISPGPERPQRAGTPAGRPSRPRPNRR